jgi:hypothetical protein
MIRSSSSDRKLVPADAELQEFERRIAADAGVGRVNFYGVEQDGTTIWSVIYQDGPRRATVQMQARPQESDVVDISTALRTWARDRGSRSSYTTEVPALPLSEWS